MHGNLPNLNRKDTITLAAKWACKIIKRIILRRKERRAKNENN